MFKGFFGGLVVGTEFDGAVIVRSLYPAEIAASQSNGRFMSDRALDCMYTTQAKYPAIVELRGEDAASLVLQQDSDCVAASAAGQLRRFFARGNSHPGVTIRGIGSLYIGKSFLQEATTYPIDCLGIYLSRPHAIIREFQGEKFDGWSIVGGTYEAFEEYIAGFAKCPTGGPTELVIAECGGTIPALHDAISFDKFRRLSRLAIKPEPVGKCGTHTFVTIKL